MKLPEVRPVQGAAWAVPLALVVVIGVGITLGLELAILSLAGFVLVGVIALFWSSVRNLSGDTPLSIDEALGMGAPTAAEEQKRAVLRALKDLEFERSVGKISEQDYLEFSTRYRAEAKRLIAAVDERLGPVQELAEKLANERLIQAGLADDPAKAKTSVAAANAPEAEDRARAPEETDSSKSESVRAVLAKVRACPSCKTDNDLDAMFCKRCGTALDAAGPVAPARAVEEEAQ